MKRILIAGLAVVLSFGVQAKDDKNQKGRKAVEKEESRFERAVGREPANAQVYLEHANNLAAMNSEAARAEGFYKLALKYDSGNAVIFKDYGIYLADRLHSFTDAKRILAKGLTIEPANADMRRYMESVNKILALQDADNKLRDYGTVGNAKPLMGDAKQVYKFDSLRKCTQSGAYEYKRLEARYLVGDATLTAAELYMLIVGFAASGNYNPFNYSEISAMRMQEVYNLDTAISKGLELVKTNPINPSLNRELMYCYRKKNEQAEADKYLARIKMFFAGVLYSGDGSCERPYVALWSKEEYNFLTYLGYPPAESHYMSNCAGQMAEVINVTDASTGKEKPVNFNVALIFMQTVGK